MRLIKYSLIFLVFLYLTLFWVLRAPVFSSTDRFTIGVLPSPQVLKDHVEFLSFLKPNRSIYHPTSLQESTDYIQKQFEGAGYTVERQAVRLENMVTYNLVVTYEPPNLKNMEDQVVVVGAHYDVAGDRNPGADDNASGVAGLIELARLCKDNRLQTRYPIQFVAYTTEEPPYFAGTKMGSYVHAKTLHEQGLRVRMMYSLEMIGYFSDKLFSQKFPIPVLYLLYPWTGDFIAIIGQLPGHESVQKVKRSFLAVEGLSSYSISAPAALVGIDFSDHRNYWDFGWPAVMISDTAFYRNIQYHKPGDTADRLNYKKMALVVQAMYQSLADLD